MNHNFYITPEEYERAEQNGIKPALLEVRIRSLAWNKERAVTTPPHKKKKLDKEWIKVASNNGICYSTFKYRVNELGWTQERAATQALQDRKKQAKKASEASRVYPVKYIKKATKNGIPYDTFRHRIYLGWDPEEAATKSVMTGREIGLMNKEKCEKYLRRLFV